ncbi:MAG: TRAP transporter small permease [Lachnotalea sp.]
MKKAVELLQKIQLTIGTIFLVIFLLTVVFQVSSRYLGIVATWTEEVSMYSFIWAVFMGAAAMVYEKKHFAFTSLSDVLKSKKIKRILSVVISIIMLTFAILMLKYGIDITKKFWNYTWVSIPEMKKGFSWLCLPICGGTSVIYLIYLIFDDVQHIKKGDY